MCVIVCPCKRKNEKERKEEREKEFGKEKKAKRRKKRLNNACRNDNCILYLIQQQKRFSIIERRYVERIYIHMYDIHI